MISRSLNSVFAQQPIENANEHENPLVADQSPGQWFKSLNRATDLPLSRMSSSQT